MHISVKWTQPGVLFLAFLMGWNELGSYLEILLIKWSKLNSYPGQAFLTRQPSSNDVYTSSD